MTDPHVGRLVYLRIYSGVIKTGQSVLNSTKSVPERIGKLVLLHADQRELIEEAYAGEIVAAVGLKDTTTGHTLCDPAFADYFGINSISGTGNFFSD